MDIVVRCATCYPVRLGDCPDALTFNIGITANTEYAYEICDSQGNTYEGETTTNGSGNVSISTSDVPFDAYPGLFNKWSGSFRLTLYDGDGDAVPFTVSGTEYTCIAFSFRETVELDECNNEITCGCISGNYGVPSDLNGQDGDFYINADTGAIYEKVDGVWTLFWSHGSAAVADGDYGDITVSGSGNTWTIDNDAVTFAKMQNIATDKLLGRDTAGSGNVEEIGLDDTLEFTGTGNIQRAALTGDVTAPAGSNAMTLPVVNANVGSFTNATVTVNAKGQVTAASSGAASSSKCIFAGQYSTVSSSAGLGISANWVYFGSILIPGGTVSANDMIVVETLQIGNGASTLTPTWALRDQASAPLSTDTLGVAGANGTSYIVMFNATGVFNCGMRHQFIAKSSGFYMGSTGGLVGNSVINHYTFQSISTGTTYADNTTMSWATDKYIVACHRSAAAATMQHVLTTVKIYRP